jgi:poly-beta-1,6-N-acetyl-D-glucosamine synthase
MIILLWITLSLIIIYMAYPVCLFMFSPSRAKREKETEEVNSVSLIFLSYNGKIYLEEKIRFLIDELSSFQRSELIIIDDNSSDGTKEILEQFRDIDGIKIILKNGQKGIVNSMNLGVSCAKFDHIVFCDQRQNLSGNILKRILEPFKYKHVGAVSGCLSHLDKEDKDSILRRHENFIKTNESKSGSLIGVYGPFYAIRKQCYSVIPEYIILDDLYLSLRILKANQIILLKDCTITDEDFSILYDYKRTRRYLSGLLQILREKNVFSDLSFKHKIMLLWHKYLRLLLPVFFFASFIIIGFLMTHGVVFIILFCILAIVGLISALPDIFRFQAKISNILRVNAYYFIALFDIFFCKVFMSKTGKI